MKKRFESKAIHKKDRNASNALSPPIFQTTTFEFDNLKHADRVMSFRSNDYVYTRGNNPNLRSFEQQMSRLEKGKSAVAFSSGMGAISTTLLSLLKPEDKIIVHRTLYGSSFNLVHNLLPKYNIKVHFADFRNIDDLIQKINNKTRVIFFETPANPNLDVINIQNIISHKNKDITVVVDNTFATPYFQNPLTLGADIVVHSATKYIGGHGDALGGIVIAKNEEYIHKLKFDYMCELGNVLSPFNAWIFLRGLKTLALRMEKHQKNAIELAKYLHNNKLIEQVIYPGLKSDKGYTIAKKQMLGFGGIINFTIKKDIKKIENFINNLQMCKLAVSLGDTETLVEVPALMTHKDYSRQDLERFGLSENMIRVSVGLEHSKDIIADFEQALDKI